MSADHHPHSAPPTTASSAVKKPTESQSSVDSSLLDRLKREKSSRPIPSLLAHEWGFWTAFAVGVFLLLILFSYDPSDPGFFSSGNVDNIHNWGDATGAWLSSFLLFVFGVFAYVIPFGVWMVGYVVFWINVEHQQIDKQQLMKSSASLVLMLSSGAGMATMYLNTSDWTAPLPYSGGGMWGYWVASLFVGLIDRLAATLALLLLFGLSISWMLGVSWFRIMDATGEVLWNAFYQGKHWFLTSARPKLSDFKDIVLTRYKQYREGHDIFMPERRLSAAGVPASEGTGTATTAEQAHWSSASWQKTLFSFIRWHSPKPEDRLGQRPVGGGYGVEPNLVSQAMPNAANADATAVPSASVASTTASHVAEKEPVDPVVASEVALESADSTTNSTASSINPTHTPNTSLPIPSGVPASIVIDPTAEPVYPIHLSNTPEAWSVPITPTPTNTENMVSPIEETHPPEPEVEVVEEKAVQADNPQQASAIVVADVQASLPPWEDIPVTEMPISPTLIPVHQSRAVQPTEMPLPAEAQLPSLALLNGIPERKQVLSDETLQEMGQILEKSLQEYNIKAEVVGIIPGPVVTLFELQPAPGVRVGSITNLVKDLARSMSVMAVRVVDIIPGKSVIGIEMPNPSAESISFREVLSSDVYRHTDMILPLVLGKDTKGEPIVADLAKMPHVLVAGQTGSGKSVGVNAMIVSLLYHARADQVKFIMIDPKMLELSVYQDIPHLLAPVVTDMSEAANALRWCVVEMERRYQLMSKLGVRNIAGFNEKVQAAIDRGEPIIDPLATMPELSTFDLLPDMPTLVPLPYIVVIVDEFADLFMVVGKKIEELIARLAQKARAAGIHLVLATQRPSVDVVTGLIKANIPARIAFKVAQKVDSRTILDQMGADQLLGRGDMLYLGNGMSFPQRVHGPFVSDEEVHRVVEFLKTQGKPDYQELDLSGVAGSANSNPSLTGLFKDDAGGAEKDTFYDEAVAFVLQSKKVSVSSIQRKFSIGYNRAARMVEAMEEAGIVSTPLSNGNREILMLDR